MCICIKTYTTVYNTVCVCKHNRWYKPGAMQDNLPMSEDNYAMHGAAVQLNITRNHYMQLCAPVIMISCAACNELSRRIETTHQKVSRKWGLSSFIKRRNLAACVSKWAASISNVCKLAALCLQEKKQRRRCFALCCFSQIVRKSIAENGNLQQPVNVQQVNLI